MKKLWILSGASLFALTAVFSFAALQSHGVGTVKAAGDGEYEMNLLANNTTTAIGAYDEDGYAYPFSFATVTPTGASFSSDDYDGETGLGSYVLCDDATVLSTNDQGLLDIVASKDSQYALMLTIQFTFFNRAYLNEDNSYVHVVTNPGENESRDTVREFEYIQDTEYSFSITLGNFTIKEGEVWRIEKIHLEYICI